jgi:hypothetical protein
MLATPPGLEPMPRAQDSVPRTGAESRPVKTMSRKTVPVRQTSQGGPPGAQRGERIDLGLPACGGHGPRAGEACSRTRRAGVHARSVSSSTRASDPAS